MRGNFGNDDRLGIGLRSRARTHRQLFEDQDAENYQQLRQDVPGIGLYGPLRSAGGRQLASGPLPDSMWEGFKQALYERGTDTLADDSVGQRGRGRRGRATFPPSLAALLTQGQDF